MSMDFTWISVDFYWSPIRFRWILIRLLFMLLGVHAYSVDYIATTYRSLIPRFRHQVGSRYGLEFSI